LDLDETIIHSWFKKIPNADIEIDVKIKNRQSTIYVLVRPGAYRFLKEMQRIYEVVFYTASVSTYAVPLIRTLDKLDYGFKMLFREHCDLKDKSFVKDLSKVGRDMKDIIIVDNTPGCYRLNKHNALPIVSWFEDPDDSELSKMIPLLQKLAKVTDVRHYIKKVVKNNKIRYNKIHKVFKDFNKEKLDKSLDRSFDVQAAKNKTQRSESQSRAQTNNWIL